MSNVKRTCLHTHAYVLLGDYAGFPGCGLLRLHSTYRHDLKIYASDEGRVQMTAAAFAKVNMSFVRAGEMDNGLIHINASKVLHFKEATDPPQKKIKAFELQSS